MGRQLMVTIAMIATVFLTMTVVPSPYNDRLLLILMLGCLGLVSYHAWRARQLASKAPLVATLRRTGHQRISLIFAMFFTIMLVTLMRSDPQMASLPGSNLTWILLGLIGIQLLTALPANKITEAGLVIEGALLPWESMKNPEWARGEPATLSFGIEVDGKLVNGKWKFHQAEIEPVTAALTRYAGYSPIAGS